MIKEPPAETAPAPEQRSRVREIPLVSIWGLILILTLLIVQGIIFYFLFSTERGLWGWVTAKSQEEIAGRTVELGDFVLTLRAESEAGIGVATRLNVQISLGMSEKSYIKFKPTVDKLLPWIGHQIVSLGLERTRSQLDSLTGMRELAQDIKNLINKKLGATEEVVQDVFFPRYIFI